MKVVFSKRALGDLLSASEYTRRKFGGDVAAALELRIRTIVMQIGEFPETAPRVEQRFGIRVIPIGRYPYRLFYRLRAEDALVLHIRHTSRRSERGE